MPVGRGDSKGIVSSYQYLHTIKQSYSVILAPQHYVPASSSPAHPPPSCRSHVLHGDVLEDLAVVDVPDGLIVPDLGGQQDSTKNDPLPVPWTDVDLCVGQEPLQVDLHVNTQTLPKLHTLGNLYVVLFSQIQLTSVTIAHSAVS